MKKDVISYINIKNNPLHDKGPLVKADVRGEGIVKNNPELVPTPVQVNREGKTFTAIKYKRLSEKKKELKPVKEMQISGGYVRSQEENESPVNMNHEELSKHLDEVL